MCPVFNSIKVAALFCDVELRLKNIPFRVPCHRHYPNICVAQKCLEQIAEAMICMILRIYGAAAWLAVVAVHKERGSKMILPLE